MVLKRVVILEEVFMPHLSSSENRSLWCQTLHLLRTCVKLPTVAGTCRTNYNLAVDVSSLANTAFTSRAATVALCMAPSIAPG